MRITDLRHFHTESGEIAPPSGPARPLAEQLKRIVAAFGNAGLER